MARVFCIKQGAKWSKINAVSRHPVEDCLKLFKRGSLTLSGKLKYAPLAKSRWTISSCPCLADQLNAEFPSCFQISKRTIITLKYLLTTNPSYPIYFRKKFWGMLKKEWIDSVVFKILFLPDLLRLCVVPFPGDNPLPLCNHLLLPLLTGSNLSKITQIKLSHDKFLLMASKLKSLQNTPQFKCNTPSEYKLWTWRMHNAIKCKANAHLQLIGSTWSAA